MRFLSYDTETTGLRRHKAEMFSYSICDQDGKAGVFRLDGSPVRQATSKYMLEKIWSDKTLPKIMHGIKFDLGFTERKLKRKLRDHPMHDTMLQSQLLRNHHHSHALKDLSWELSGYPRDDQYAIKPYTRGGQNWQYIPEDLFNIYQERDAKREMLLHMLMWPKIKDDKEVLDIYQNEMEVSKLTLDIEDRGVMLDPQKCAKLMSRLHEEALILGQRINQVAFNPINPRSRDDVAELLYKQLRLPITFKTKTGLPSVDKEALMLLLDTHPHPVIDLLLRYNSRVRGISNIQGYLNRSDDNYVLHPNIGTNDAATGRETCSDPNLQNVEKETGLLNPYPIPARMCFRPKPGYVNFHLDYSGIEMRLLVYYSREPELLKIAREGGDMHLPGVMIFYGKRFTSADKMGQKSLRDAAKNGNFAVGYGAQDFKVAKTINVPFDQTHRDRMALYRATFPKFCGQLLETIREVVAYGYIKTRFGRRLHIPYALAHEGINHKIQGTAAEILKRGQVRVHQILEQETSGEMGIILPVHDELIIECPRKRLGDAIPILRKVRAGMIDFGDYFDIPLEVKVEVATTDWNHKKEFDLCA